MSVGEQNPYMPQMVPHHGIIVPDAPQTVEATGVDFGTLADLCLKSAITVPQCTTEWLAGQVRLPLPIVEELMEKMRVDQLVEVLGQVGPYNRRYATTDRGRERGRTLMEICGYVGPAPVSLENYNAMLQWQVSKFPKITFDQVKRALGTLTLTHQDVHTSALAASANRSLFLSGPPGNGKTSVARAIHNAVEGDIWIPHCISVGTDIIRVFDTQSHELSDFQSPQPWKIDNRWIRVKRPFILVGGEMTIETLDLNYSPSLRFYEAPLHFKANGGTFVIDDFGRQRVAPSELLNRWIVPLENLIDYLTLRTGLKIMVPFKLFLVVATNLDPQRVMDPAFLRRMGYRVEVSAPTPEMYRNIFKNYLARYNAKVKEDVLDRLLERYIKEKRELRGCEPRDLIERCRDIAMLENAEIDINDHNLDMAWAGYFGIERTISA